MSRCDLLQFTNPRIYIVPQVQIILFEYPNDNTIFICITSIIDYHFFREHATQLEKGVQEICTHP